MSLHWSCWAFYDSVTCKFRNPHQFLSKPLYTVCAFCHPLNLTPTSIWQRPQFQTFFFFFFGFCPLRPDLVHDSSRTLDCEAYFTVFESLSVSSLYGILLHQIIYCHVLFPAGTCILVLFLSWECKLLKGRDHVLKFCIHHSASHSAWHKGAE